MSSLPAFHYKELDHRQIDSSLKTFGVVKIALKPRHAEAMRAWIRSAESVRNPKGQPRLSQLLAAAGFFGTFVRVLAFHTKLVQAASLVVPVPVEHSLYRAPDGFFVFQFTGAQHGV